MTVLQINIGDHSSPVPGYTAFPVRHRAEMRWARGRALWIAGNKPSANNYFSSLAVGCTLTQLLADSTLWVNYHATMPKYGETEFTGGKEMAISEYSCKMGRWTMLATLIHELAHVNGVEDTHDAEFALIHCGLGNLSERTTCIDDPATPYDPNING